MGTRVWISDARVYQGGVCNYISVTRSSLIFRWRRTGMNIIRQNGYWYRRTTAVPDKWPCPRVARTRDKFSTPPLLHPDPIKLPCNEPWLLGFEIEIFLAPIFSLPPPWNNYITVTDKREGKNFRYYSFNKRSRDTLVPYFYQISGLGLLRFLIKNSHFQRMGESIKW